jgi:hypothetical protein
MRWIASALVVLLAVVFVAVVPTWWAALLAIAIGAGLILVVMFRDW